ncbi:DUF6789 family protein [Microvirga arabica]|uniref:DUF6789 family protein n=1 Tax=Microvirga arabica TaxID=1128671 RepID=UPI00193A83B3|nr:DUF6789 family protein [Microvirga arabica]MBM1172809.1 hypothetical protein [Microvirga arabica]
MIDIGKGIIAGLIASAAVSGVVFFSAMVGLAPSPDPVHALTGILFSPLGLSWVVHFVLGTCLWGPLFSILTPILPGPFWFKGAVFGTGAWLVMLLVVWAADPTVSPEPALMPVALHLLFGVTLGLIYAVLLPAKQSAIQN